jgi:hypothetical protein
MPFSFFTKAIASLPILAIGVVPISSQSPQAVLETHLFPAPITFHHDPLSNAIGRIGVLDVESFVVFGIEIEEQNGEEPKIEGEIPARATLRGALETVLGPLKYTFEVVSPHLINVYPTGAKSAPNDILNVQVKNFNLSNVSPSNFLSNPPRYVSSVADALSRGKPKGCEIGPGLSDRRPGISLQASNVTLRQAMNLVSTESIGEAIEGKSSALGWLYLHDRSPKAGAPADSWRVHYALDPAKDIRK